MLPENYGLLTSLWKEFRDSLLMKSYDDLVNLFNKERKLLESIYSDLQFWKDKLLYDGSKWKAGGVRGHMDIRSYLTTIINRGHTILAAIILSDNHRKSLEGRKFYIMDENKLGKPNLFLSSLLRLKISHIFNTTYPFKLESKPIDKNPLHRAAIKGNHLLVKLLLKKINPSFYGTDLIDIVINNDDIKMARILMDDKRMRTPNIIFHIKKSDYNNLFKDMI